MNKPIYRHMDQAALDAEYNNRDKVADFSAFLEEWAALSKTARAELRCALDITFDPQSGQSLDIFYPATPEPQPGPVQIFFHGGYWFALDKDYFSYVARAFAPHGITTVIVDYSLIPDVTMDEIVRQCRQSVAWVRKHADDHSIDPEQVHISGHSAGGHLVATTMAARWNDFDVPEGVIKSGMGISGLYDLAPISKCFLQTQLNLDAATVARNSPVHDAPPSHGHLSLVVGALEGEEYFRQSAAQHQAWPGCTDAPIAMNPYNHFSIISSLAEPSSDLARLIRRQMQQA